jgi:hypothetical protein
MGGGAENADNGEMDAEQTKKYKTFVRSAWEKAVNHNEGERIADEEFLLSVDKDGYRHTTTSQRIRHIYKQHGNEKAEKARGQIVITESDIELIPDIIENFTYSVRNFTYAGENAVFYAKQGDENTYIYVENISAKRHRKNTATFFKFGYKKDDESLFRILENSNSDVSKAEIIGGGGGGNPTNTLQTKPQGTVADSVDPSDTSLSPDSGEKSSGRIAPQISAF